MSTSSSSSRQRLSWLFAACAASTALGGCWDDGHDTTPPAPPPVSGEVPASAFASVEALFSFGVEQTADAHTLETSEPLQFNLVAGDPPVSDTTEPSPII